jgi:hypothetical protein
VLDAQPLGDFVDSRGVRARIHDKLARVVVGVNVDRHRQSFSGAILSLAT